MNIVQHDTIAGFEVPRVDLQTFNYGRALGKPTGKLAPQYEHVETYLRALQRVSAFFSAAAWRLEMALRDVRNAETEADQDILVGALSAIWHDVDASLDRVQGQCGLTVLKWFRYGRIGNVRTR
jgi:hypothetical protein